MSETPPVNRSKKPKKINIYDKIITDDGTKCDVLEIVEVDGQRCYIVETETRNSNGDFEIYVLSDDTVKLNTE